MAVKTLDLRKMPAFITKKSAAKSDNENKKKIKELII